MIFLAPLVRCFSRLIYRMNGWLTRPEGLHWSERYQRWVTVHPGGLCEWTRLHRQNVSGTWVAYVSYGRDVLRESANDRLSLAHGNRS